MRSGRKLPWIIYALCALLVVDGLGWVTWRLVRLEREQRESQREAALQETLRLALWRMDSVIAPMLAGEAGRPYFQYRALIPRDRAYAQMWRPLEPDEDLSVSPLVTASGRFIRLHFEWDPDGSLRSPQAPRGWVRQRVAGRYVEPSRLARARADLEALRALLEQASGDPASLLERSSAGPGPIGLDGPRPGERGTLPRDAADASATDELGRADGADRAATDFRARQQLALQAKKTPPEQEAFLNRSPVDRGDKSPAPADGSDADGTDAKAEPRPGEPAFRDRLGDAWARASAARGPAGPETEIRQGPFEGVWLDDPSTGRRELVFVRRVTIGSRALVQGFWVDWLALRQDLLGRVMDLVPGADLEPVLAPANEAAAPDAPESRTPTPTHRLATIPARLMPSGVPSPPGTPVTSMRATLVVTWIAVLVAIGAIGVVLHASMRLSDRRGRFVSAVTHELRTPLTTFCLYSQMLADGMVEDEHRRREYLRTLKSESSRLAGIVENVLTYARMGGRRPEAGSTTTLGEVLDAITSGLERRAKQDGLGLELEADEHVRARRVPAEREAIERILTNLVDNACKYASDGSEPRVHLRARADRRRVRVEVADHGPGISAGERGRIFSAFHRAESGRGEGRGGLGLGLALSRGLARSLGGELELVRTSGRGAVFRLTLPSRG